MVCISQCFTLVPVVMLDTVMCVIHSQSDQDSTFKVAHSTSRAQSAHAQCKAVVILHTCAGALLVNIVVHVHSSAQRLVVSIHAGACNKVVVS